ncbi:CoA-binding protein [Haloplanus sp. GCM10025708]|uniref:CoA-binding protein n=1 Tax=Haloplanus sp. GCM10025708 TaxID=3252679 RepID=UPI0036208FE5
MDQSRPDLDPLFDPDSVAVVGASPDSWYSARLMDNLLDYGYEGTVYPVNPSRDEAWGRTCYDGIDDVPEAVDLAVVSVPREHVVDVVRDAGERGVPAALVITAGFGEADEEGAELEAELAAVAEEQDVRVCGPNCIGLANVRSGTVLTSTCSRKPDPGHIGLASHSGALAFTTFFERAADEDVDFAHIVSTGNEADQSLTDYVEYMAGDPEVDVICVYVEGLDDPRRFVDVASAATRSGTPVLAVKIGRSDVAQAAAASHTGSLTGSDAVWESALWQAGVERVPDVPDLIGRASVHAAFDAPDSPRTCIASTSGGLATLLADLADARGLELPRSLPTPNGPCSTWRNCSPSANSTTPRTSAATGPKCSPKSPTTCSPTTGSTPTCSPSASRPSTTGRIGSRTTSSTSWTAPTTLSSSCGPAGKTPPTSTTRNRTNASARPRRFSTTRRTRWTRYRRWSTTARRGSASPR